MGLAIDRTIQFLILGLVLSVGLMNAPYAFAVDTDGDGFDDDDGSDNCPGIFNPSQADFDADGLGDACDTDDDGDGVLDVNDPDPLNLLVCGDSDGDTCDDCSAGFGQDPSNDGVDSNGDGICDAGDDFDLDGYTIGGGDCNDSDSSINPGATEIPADGVDQNCDGLELCYVDSDGDLYGSSSTSASSDLLCLTDPLLTDNSLDCDDGNPSAYPNAQEFCDAVDNNCDGQVDETFPESGQTCDGPDADSCLEGTTLCVAGSLSCSDSSGDSLEICSDGVDNDCNGVVDDPLLCGDFCFGQADGTPCDDGNPLTINEECSSDVCQGGINTCGDGICQIEEEGLCSADCIAPGFCGDGVLDVGEQCDDSNDIDGDGCNSQCMVECSTDAECSDPNYPVCGDDGFGGLACISAVGSVCGNGVTEAGEQCDDGNTNPGDGCSSNCLLEQTEGASGNVEVLATCGLTIVSGDPINYGQLFPSAISAEQNLVLDNTGNIVASLLVKGSPWVDGGGVVVMNVGDTKWSLSSNSYGSKTALMTTDDLMTAAFDPVIDLDSYWQLQANILDPSFAGGATQTMDFTITC